MINLYISPRGSGFCTIDEEENLIDISDQLKEEVFFHQQFSTLLDEYELLVDDEEVEEIFIHIAEKVYLSGEKNAGNHRLNDFKYTNEITGQTRKKLLVAFSRILKQACENKLKQEITLEYL